MLLTAIPHKTVFTRNVFSPPQPLCDDIAMESTHRLTHLDFNNQVATLVSSGATLWTRKSRVDEFLTKHVWMEAPHRIAHNGSVKFVTYYVYYDDNYQQPQIGFSDSTLGSDVESELQAFFPNLLLLNFAPDGDPGEQKRPMASFSYCSAVDAPLWSIHPCDTTKLLECGRLDDVPGVLLSVFLQVMAPYACLPAALFQ